MFASFKTNYHIKRQAYAQIMSMPYVSSVGERLPSIYRQIVLPFLSRYWNKKVKDGRFLFSTPGLLEQSLGEADGIPENYRAQFILREIMRGLNLNIPQKDVPSWIYEQPPTTFTVQHY